MTAIDFFKSKGFVPAREGSENWAISWGQRSGYDFTTLEFYPHGNDRTWSVIISHHASGTNPRMAIGTCETLEEIQQTYDLIRRINGYPGPEAELHPT